MYINRFLLLTVTGCLLFNTGFTQFFQQQKTPLQDSLRGSVTRERAWWDVIRYDITVEPNINNKTITGKTDITYKVTDNTVSFMQIDLQAPLEVDSVYLNNFTKVDVVKRDVDLFYLLMPPQTKGKKNKLTIYYHGKPLEAVRPPWQGGFIWETDSLGRPWISVACQGLGASVWFPCKDHQSDEPDEGATITMIVPDTLTGVGNGRLVEQKKLSEGKASFKWAVRNPINNYNIVPYIGKYVNTTREYKGEKGRLTIDLWSLDYNREKMTTHALPDVLRTLNAMEHWFGPYPFYNDGYKLVEAPHLGMEHQSAVAYGNDYVNGYRGKDISSSGHGLNFDFIIVHESGHEWFGNSITAGDIADMWIHESFTNLSEALFTEKFYGKEAAIDYVVGIRGNILNDKPIIGKYRMNEEGSGDMYYKGVNMLQNIRTTMNDENKFRNMLREMNKVFYHKIVDNAQVQQFINQYSEINFSKTFEQYLTTTQIPTFEFYFSPDDKKVFYRYIYAVEGFDMPLVLVKDGITIRLLPGFEWQSYDIDSDKVKEIFSTNFIERKYYLNAKEIED